MKKIRNYFIKNFLEDINLRIDKWELFEWVVLQELVKKWVKEIKYRRTKTKIEVDFVIDNVLNVDIIEAKFKDNIKSKDFYWLKRFKEIYQNLVNNVYLISKYGFSSCYEGFNCMNIFQFIANFNR